MIKNENRMYADDIVGVAELSLGDCFETGKDDVVMPVYHPKKTNVQKGKLHMISEFNEAVNKAELERKKIEEVVMQKVADVNVTKNAVKQRQEEEAKELERQRREAEEASKQRQEEEEKKKVFSMLKSQQSDEMRHLIEEEEKSPKYAPTPISRAVVGPHEGWW